MAHLQLPRERTAELDRRVEDAVGLPASVRSRADDVGLLEGSPVGGRVLAPALRAAVGEVPTAFFAGDGRSRARAWQSVDAAVRRADDGLTGDVLPGACTVFPAFDSHLTASDSAVDRLSLP